jgi:O-antigen/teichoic acid export membrane protein
MINVAFFQRLSRSAAVRRLSANAGWLLVERVLNLSVSLGVSILTARYLGPESFGVLNYSVAFAALFGFLPYLGLDTMVTRRLMEEPDAAGELLGTSFALRMSGGIVGAALPILFALLSSGDPLTRLMIAIVALGMLFDATNVVDLWFQSRMESRYAVQARTFASFSGAAMRVALILSGASLVYFAIATVAQQVVQAVALQFMYRRRRQTMRWTWCSRRARELMSKSWPLLLSSLGALIYLKIDQLMLGLMVGNREVGVYSVAARLSEVWWFIPAAAGASILSVLVDSRSAGEDRYREHTQRMYDIMAWGGILIAAAISVAAPPLIGSLYGAEYARAAVILQVHIWTCPVIFMTAVLNRWFLMEDLQILSLTRSLVGAFVNVAANLLLIPRYGGLGAAVATLLSYTAAGYFACFLNRRTIPAGWMMTRALAAPVRLLARGR